MEVFYKVFPTSRQGAGRITKYQEQEQPVLSSRQRGISEVNYGSFSKQTPRQLYLGLTGMPDSWDQRYL